jgi:hypothetical protein
VTKIIATIALGAASLGIVVQPAGAGLEAAQPDPAKVQAWATKAQKYKSRFVPTISGNVFDRNPADEETLYAAPVGGGGTTGVIRVLDLAYFRTFQLKTEDNDDDGIELGINASNYIDDVRRILTHSPDKDLNKRINKAVDCVGDAFDNYGYDGEKAVARCEGRWAKIEATLKLYGVDTGEPWMLSGNSPPPPPPPPSVTYDLTGQGSVSVTMQNASGGTEQFETRLPYHLDLGGVSGFVYISAQLEDTGTVTCEIKQGEQVIQTATSTGQYVIATCSGSV